MATRDPKKLKVQRSDDGRPKRVVLKPDDDWGAFLANLRRKCRFPSGAEIVVRDISDNAEIDGVDGT